MSASFENNEGSNATYGRFTTRTISNSTLNEPKSDEKSIGFLWFIGILLVCALYTFCSYRRLNRSATTRTSQSSVTHEKPIDSLPPDQRKLHIDSVLNIKTFNMETIHHDVESHNEIKYGNMLQQTGTCQLHGANASESKMTNTETNLEINDTLSIVSDACKNATTDEFIAEITHGPSCAICLDPFQMGDMVSYSSDVSLCQHEYHQICITDWLMKCYQCPVCRSNYIPIPPPHSPLPSEAPSAP